MTTENKDEALWRPHGHEEFGPGEPMHVHGPESDWQVSFGMPMTMRHDDNPDIVEMMLFRGYTMNMRHAMEMARQSVDIWDMTRNEAHFKVIAFNADVILTESLMAVVDQALAGHGINPPCQLQEVESSNIRAIGYVGIVPDDRTPNGQEHQEMKGSQYVAFNGGGLYRYDDVPIEIATEFVESESKGGFLATFIKDEFQFEKVI